MTYRLRGSRTAGSRITSDAIHLDYYRELDLNRNTCNELELGRLTGCWG
jgi:hypothetical protein